MPGLDRMVGDVSPIDFTEFVARLNEDGVDLTYEDGVEQAAALLARLHANRDFLLDFALDALKAGCEEQQRDNRYNGQVLLLARQPGQHFVRANFWPAAHEPVVRASGTEHYFYDVPHDHNFDFLTLGYLGPGYESEWFDYDHDAVVGYVGEPVALRLVERGVLNEGRMLHYRALRDVHRQLPALATSVSINIVPESPLTVWRDQYVFDLGAQHIASVLSRAPGEAMLRLALLYGHGNGIDLVDQFAAHHPSHRMRWSAWRALIGAADSDDARYGLLNRATVDASPLVNQSARAMLDGWHAAPQF